MPYVTLNFVTESDHQMLVDKVAAAEIEEAEKMIEKGNRSQEKVQVQDLLCLFWGGFVSFRSSIGI